MLLVVGIAIAYDTFFAEEIQKEIFKVASTDLNFFSKFIKEFSSDMPFFYGLFSILFAVLLGVGAAFIRRFISNLRKKYSTKWLIFSGSLSHYKKFFYHQKNIFGTKNQFWGSQKLFLDPEINFWTPKIDFWTQKSIFEWKVQKIITGPDRKLRFISINTVSNLKNVRFFFSACT